MKLTMYKFSHRILVSLIGSMWTLPLFVFATSPKLANPAVKYATLNDFLLMLLDIFLYVMMPLMVFLMIYGGFKIVASGGDEKSIKTGKSIVLWSLVGAAIILGARVIYALVDGTWKLFG